MSNLKTLILSRNGIISIPEEIGLMKSLEFLDLSYNKLDNQLISFEE